MATINDVRISIVNPKRFRSDPILEIDQLSFSEPLSKTVLDWLFGRQWIRFAVAKVKRDVIGFCVFEQMPDGLLIERIAVHPSTRRRGVGSRMFRYVQSKGQSTGRIVLPVDSTDLFSEGDASIAHEFANSVGLVADRWHKTLTVFERETSEETCDEY